MGLYISIVRVCKECASVCRECASVYQKCITVCVSEVCHGVSKVCHGVCQKCVTVCQKCATVYQKCIAVYQKCITVCVRSVSQCVRSVSQCVRSVSEVVISRLTGEKAPKVPRSYQIMPDKCPKLSTKPLLFLSTLFGADAVENIFRRRNTPVFLSTIQGEIMSTPVIRLPAFGNTLTAVYQYPYRNLPIPLPRLTNTLTATYQYPYRNLLSLACVSQTVRQTLAAEPPGRGVPVFSGHALGLAGRQAAEHGSNFNHQAVVTLRPSDVSGSLQPKTS